MPTIPLILKCHHLYSVIQHHVLQGALFFQISLLFIYDLQHFLFIKLFGLPNTILCIFTPDVLNDNERENENKLGLNYERFILFTFSPSKSVLCSFFHFPHYFFVCVLPPNRIKSSCVEGTITSAWRPFSSGCSASFLMPSQCSTPTNPTRPSTKRTRSVSLILLKYGCL